MDALILNKDIWCRNWVTVIRTRYESNSTGCLVREEYSDNGTATEDGNGNPWTWVIGPCDDALYNWQDFAAVCVAENWNLYYVKFDETTQTYRVYDFNNVDVTGTVTPQSCGWSNVSPTVTNMWGMDLVTDPVGLPFLYQNVWLSTVSSITLFPEDDVVVQVWPNALTLKWGNSYSWSNWDNAYLDIQNFQFLTPGINISVTWETV